MVRDQLSQGVQCFHGLAARRLQFDRVALLGPQHQHAQNTAPIDGHVFFFDGDFGVELGSDLDKGGRGPCVQAFGIFNPKRRQTLGAGCRLR